MINAQYKGDFIYLTFGAHKVKMDIPTALKLRSAIDDALMDATDDLDPETSNSR